MYSMKNIRKFPIMIFAAAAVLAACTKNEMTPAVPETDVEITFETAPLTKTLADNQKEFVKTNVFGSYAFYHKEDWSWGTSTTDTPSFYISNPTQGTHEENGVTTSYTYHKPAVISWVASTTAAGSGAWKDASKSYYWPKQSDSKLSFFAWSLNKADLSFPEGSSVDVACDPAVGIMMQQYDVAKDKNVDFLVAEPALNKTKNENTYAREGVPTLFKHRLSFLKFTVKVKEAEYAANGIEFTLNSIKFNNVADGIAFYWQHPEIMQVSGKTSTQTYTATSQVVDKITATDVTGLDQYIYIPQSFTNDDQTVTINYTVTYDTDGNGTADVTENIPVTKKLSELTGDWGMGKKYTIDLTFALDEIKWDPAVEDWSYDDTTTQKVEIK